MPEATTLEATTTDPSVTTPPTSDTPTVSTTDPAAPAPFDWHAALPDELKADESVSKFKGKEFAEVVKAYSHASRKLGQQGVKIPGKDAKPEEVAEYRKALGVPEAPDKYELPTEGIPEGFAVDQEFMAGLQKAAHESNIPAKGFASLYRAFANQSAQAAQRMSEQRAALAAENLSKLEREWGASKEERTLLALSAMRKFAPELVDKFKAATHEPSYAAALKAWAEVGKALASDEIHGAGAQTRFTPTPDEARSDYHKWLADPQNAAALNDRSHPNHAQALAQRSKFYELMHGNKR